MRITFDIDMDAIRVGVKRDPEGFSKDNRKLLWLLEALVKCNRIYLQTHPGTPPLYQSGVKYQREPDDEEDWLDISRVLKAGAGDCEDLAAWRVAELREKGIHAKGYLKWHYRNGFTLYHVQVLLPDGSIDDPSRRLGMGG